MWTLLAITVSNGSEVTVPADELGLHAREAHRWHIEAQLGRVAR